MKSKPFYTPKAALALFAASAALLFSACGARNELERIKHRGVLKAGVTTATEGMGFFNPATQTYEGLEVEIAKLLAQDLLGGADKIKFEKITPATRGAMLENGSVDMVIAAFTINDERKLLYNFSAVYYTDSVRLLAKKERGFTSLRDLADKTIGVIHSATTRNVVSIAAMDAGITVSFSEFSRFFQIEGALNSESVDAFAMDKSVLKSYVNENTAMLADELAPQHYGVATKL
ncbi:MAG: transporter substrate-binding domain-containing protein, partial [Spirochaetaceae bacterium]|nr:transporter substrate-binding domain-containing protein [Spirochaetaceae bacterium]